VTYLCLCSTLNAYFYAYFCKVFLQSFVFYDTLILLVLYMHKLLIFWCFFISFFKLLLLLFYHCYISDCILCMCCLTGQIKIYIIIIMIIINTSHHCHLTHTLLYSVTYSVNSFCLTYNSGRVPYDSFQTEPRFGLYLTSRISTKFIYSFVKMSDNLQELREPAKHILQTMTKEHDISPRILYHHLDLMPFYKNMLNVL